MDVRSVTCGERQVISFRDKTFCASPECKNECGRKMSNEHERELKMLKDSRYHTIQVCYGYFCGEPTKGSHDD